MKFSRSDHKFASLVASFALLGVAGLGVAGLGAGAVQAVPEKARPCDSFVETIGVGSRFDWMFGEGKIETVRRALRASRIRYIRTGALPEGADPIKYTEAMRNVTRELGIKVCLNIGWDPRANSENAIARWTQAPSPVYALEGANESFERPGWGSKEWDDSLALQRFIWQAGRRKNLDIYSWTLGGPAGYYWGMPREADKYATHANVHPYHWYANPGGRGNTKMNGLWQNTETPENAGTIAAARNAWMKNPAKPFVSTEFGWGLDTLPGNYVGVSEEVQAKYLARGLLENFNAGMERGFIYSLFPHNDDFGIARANGTLRPSGQAIADLIFLTGEPGSASIATTSLDYSLRVDSGLKTMDNHDLRDDEIHHTLLQKKNRRFLLILWADKDSQKGDAKPENATLTLPAGAKSVRIWKPVTKGTAAVAMLGTIAPGGTVRLVGDTAIPDHPLVIEIEGTL